MSRGCITQGDEATANSKRGLPHLTADRALCCGDGSGATGADSLQIAAWGWGDGGAVAVTSQEMKSRGPVVSRSPRLHPH